MLLIGSAIWVLEFKVGASAFLRAARDELGVGLRSGFEELHQSSHEATIVPWLSQQALPIRPNKAQIPQQETRYCRRCSQRRRLFPAPVHSVMLRVTGKTRDPATWEAGRYSPTPTIMKRLSALIPALKSR